MVAVCADLSPITVNIVMVNMLSGLTKDNTPVPDNKTSEENQEYDIWYNNLEHYQRLPDCCNYH